MRLRQLPNIITIMRLSATFMIMLLLAFEKDTGTPLDKLLCILSAAAFTLAMSSDSLDGYLARKYGWTTTFGKLVDPLADKMLFLTAMIMLIPLNRIPAWLVATFFIREVMITSLRGLAVEQGLVIQADHWGKYKSAFISCALVGLLLHYPFLGINWRLLGWALLWPGFILSIGSGFHYAYSYFKEYGLR